MNPVYDGEWVVSSLVRDRAERLGDKVAVRAPGEDVTYAELARRAASVARGYVELGVRPGDRVATMLDSSTAYLAAWFGSAWSGAIEVPVNVDFKGAFLHHVLRESQAKVLVVDARWIDRLVGLDLPDLEHLVVVNGDVAAADGLRPATGFDELLALDPLAAPVPRTEHDLVYVMYTSGTTGPSKGAMHVNRSALWNVYAWLDILDLSHRDVAYSMFPLFHVTARSAVVTSSIWAGASIVLRNGFSVSGFWDDIRANDCTFFAYMGSVIHLLWAAEPSPRDADNSLRVAFGAAAPAAIVADFERRFGVELLEVYGSTELGPATAPKPGQVKRGTMGRTCPHVELQIHDEMGNQLPVGVAGEIVARPAVPYGIFQGYWANPQATVQAFRNLWFHTGDRGHFDEDGYLVFSDRIKDVIRRRGENISSFEVERGVQEHPDVLECAAYAVPSDIGEEEVMIAVVPRPDRSLDPLDVLRFCAATLPRFAVPRYLRVVDELPKTPSQRIQKYKLREVGVTHDTIDRQTTGITVARS